MSTTSQSGASSSTSLVRGLRAGNSEAWSQMVELYAPLVRTWCLHAGVPEHRLMDILQETFLSVHRAIGGFRKQESTTGFRGWLWMITRNKIRDYFREASEQPAAMGGSTALGLLHQVEDVEFSDEPSQPGDTALLLHRALEMVKVEFREKTWEAFCLTAISGKATDEVAESLGLSAAAVRQAKSRVLRRLRQQLGDL